MKVMMIIPAYNEEANIVKTVSAVRAFQKNNSGFFLDYIVIDDGSTDRTLELCHKNGINVISLIRNLGIGGAVQTGYKFAEIKGYDIAVQFDGDGQHDMDSLPKLVAPIMDGSADFAIGSRFVDKSSQFQSTFMRRIGIRFLSTMIKICTGVRITDPTSGFRAAGKDVISSFARDYPSDYPEPESVVGLIRDGYRVKEIQVNMFERIGGRSSIRPLNSIYYIIKVSLAIICRSFQKRRKGS